MKKENYPIFHDILFICPLVCSSKPVFMVYYHDLYADVSFGDYFSVMWLWLTFGFITRRLPHRHSGLILIASAWTDSSIPAASGKSISD